MKFVQVAFAALVFAVSMATARVIEGKVLETRQSNSTTAKYVFAHFMVGITSNRQSAADWDSDMARAKAYGIDAFALNIGTDYFTDTQLGYAYASAASVGMKLFLSFDFNWYSTGSAVTVGQKIAQYAKLPAQLTVDGKVFVSTFVGDGVDVNALRNAAGTPIYFVPNFHPTYGTDFSSSDGGFNWMAWPNNGNNRAPDAGQTGTVEAGDQAYLRSLGSKAYMAPVSPWFFTHYGSEVSYSKNWMFPGELLWYTRWQQLLSMNARFIEIISWNDYGESHYVGPLSSPHLDDGSSKWVNDMPHNAWLDMAKPYIAAFKAGATSVANYIPSDQLVYWYRPQLMNTNCDATDTCMQPLGNPDYYVGRPNGWTSCTDSVFVVSLLKSAGVVTVGSGNNTKTFNAPAGASSFTVPMYAGKQTFSLTRNSQTVLSATSLKDVSGDCVCGIYNFNAYAGSVPASINDALQGDGYNKFTNGLKVTTCSATPSLGSATSTTATSTSTSSASTLSSTTTAIVTSVVTTTISTLSSTTTSSATSTSQTSSTSSKTSSTTSTTSPSTTASTTASTTSTTASTTASTTPSTTSSSSKTSSTTASTTASTTPSTTSKSSSTTSPSTTASTTTSSSKTSTSSTTSSSSSFTTTPKSSSTTTTSTISKTTTTTTSATPSPTGCNDGYGYNNYAGLCSFSCHFGYCPPGPCTCSSFGAMNPPPPSTGIRGVPADGLDGSYIGLCSFCCDRGYCPSGACKAV